MMKRAILGVDFGLSKINSTLIDVENGTLLHEAEKRYVWERQSDNYMDTNPEQLWEVSQQMVEEVLSKRDPAQVEIQAVVLSCFGETIVPVDAAGNHLYPIIGSNDIRAVEESAAVARDLPAYNAITGGNVSPASGISKLLWIKKHRPEIFDQTKGFFSLQQYILKKMGMEPYNDYTLASRKMMLDIRQKAWSEEILRYLGITEDQLGLVEPSSHVVGETDHYGRACFGRKVAVVAGGHDACSSALGLGIPPENDGGLIGNNAGTWNLMNLYYNQFVDTTINAPKLTPGSGPLKGSYYFQAAGAVGPLMDWFVRTFCGGRSLNDVSGQAVYDATCTVRLTQDPMEGDGLFRGMSLTHGLTDIFTGMIESITFPLKDMLAQFESLTGRRFEAMRISAGGAKADNWVQLKANVMNITMERVENIQASAVGAAVNAAVGVGIYANYDEAIRNMVRINRVFEPQPEMVRRYQERAEEFKAMNVKGPCFFL